MAATSANQSGFGITRVPDEDALQAALDGAIKRGEYQKVLARWGEQGEAVTQSEVNPPGITY